MAIKSPKVKEIDEKALESLIHRVEEAIEHGLALSAEDLSLLLEAIQTLATLQEQLESKDITLYKLKKLLGMINSTEKRSTGKKSSSRPKSSKKNGSTREKQPASRVIHHQHQTLKKGDICPECQHGKLYPFAPGSLLRVTAHAPYEAVKHVTERLRCNGCEQLFTAELPDEVLNDGGPNQEYGYSARALMVINKFFSGEGYNHQENLSGLMGHRISASTCFDQCEQVANAGLPIVYQMKREAAASPLLLGDDTRHRILEQEPEERPNRNGKGTRLRTGIYSSCLIAKNSNANEIALFETSLGHFGEFIDFILNLRPPDIPKPILMADALSSNKPTVIEVLQALCNAHGRRQFTDVEENYPEEVEYVLDLYENIWVNRDHTLAEEMDEQQTLQYHQEHSLPVMKTIRQWCESKAQSPDFEQHSGLGKAILYFLKHYKGLTAFCRIPGAPIDNNRTEETLKIVIRGRKNYYFFKTANGAGIANVLTSLIATAWRAGINVYDYLVHLQRYKERVAENPEHWTPYCYEQTIDDIRKQDDKKAA